MATVAPSNAGPVIIQVGATTAVVHHQLDHTPGNVTVQFPPDVDVPSMIINIGPETFQVNLDHALDHDVNFIWSVS